MTFEATTEPTVSDGRTFCAVHPTVETTLRCNKCGRYMCTRCAVRTPVGYRCRECVYQQQSVYFNATPTDNLIAAALSFGLGIPAAFLGHLGLFLVIILSLPAGGLIAEIIFRATGRRRGRYTWIAAVAGIVLSALVISGPQLLTALTALSAQPGSRAVPFGDVALYILPTLLYIALCAGAVAARLRYGK